MKRFLYIAMAFLLAAAVFIAVRKLKNEPAAPLQPYSGAASTPLPADLIPEVPPGTNMTAMAEKYRDLIKKRRTLNKPVRTMFRDVFHSNELYKVLEIRPTDLIADIGPGTGGFEIGLLESGIPFQKLFAVDIDGLALSFLKTVLDATGYPNTAKMETVHSTITDVTLPPASIDLAVIVDLKVFNAVAERDGQFSVDRGTRDCLSSLYRAIKQGGRLYVLYGTGTTAPGESPAEEARLTKSYREVGFELTRASHLAATNEFQAFYMKK